MSALGHYLEEEGIPTVAISLIRAQTEKTKPPRALWVPFELGRPFGPPSNAAFQKRVILAALRLLERERGPVIIEDFPEDYPGERPDPTWRPPFAKPDLEAPRQRGSPLRWRARASGSKSLIEAPRKSGSARSSGSAGCRSAWPAVTWPAGYGGKPRKA